MPGKCLRLPSAAYSVKRRAVPAAVLLVTNHGGSGESAISPWASERGAGRNGPRTTLFCGRSKSSALWTTPRPLWMSVYWWPGNAPHVARAVR